MSHISLTCLFQVESILQADSQCRHCVASGVFRGKVNVRVESQGGGAESPRAKIDNIHA